MTTLPGMPLTSPLRLWEQAHAEHPNDREAMKRRYKELMVEHGHIVKAKPGEDRNLPCGWPGSSDSRSVGEEGT